MNEKKNQTSNHSNRNGHGHNDAEHYATIREMIRKLQRRERMVPFLVISAAVLIASVFGLLILGFMNPSGKDKLPSSMRPNYGIIDPDQLGYEQVDEIRVELETITSLAVDEKNFVYVGGDQVINVYSPNGLLDRTIQLNGEPRCVAVADTTHDFPGRIYVGMIDHVVVFDPDGEPIAQWDILDRKALITSIAVGPTVVFVADARSKKVYCFDTDGNPINELDRDDQELGLDFFIVPTPYFDMAVSPVNGLLWVTNPGLHQIEAYTMEGRRETPLTWGTPTAAIQGFSGCCNPTSISIMQDGRFVTAEKFILRVKVYSPAGELETVVAGPDQLETERQFVPGLYAPKRTVQVASDMNGRVLVLDPLEGSVRVFEPIKV